MSIFKIDNGKLKSIAELKFDLEKDLQKITENNLEEIFRLQFVSSEFQYNNLRIDTLAFDLDSNAFVIIEYKRDQGMSVIDQGFAYLSILTNHPEVFILEYAKKKGVDVNKLKIDTTQSKVLFLANNFTIHQQNAINFKNVPIELWRVIKYDNNTISYNQIKSVNAREDITGITKDKKIAEISRKVKVYSVDDLFKDDWEKTKEIYELLRDRILELDGQIEENPKKIFIGFRRGRNNVVCLWPKSNGVNIELLRTKPELIKDPENKVKYYEKSMQYYNQHVSNLMVNDIAEVDYAMYVIKQVYAKFADKYL